MVKSMGLYEGALYIVRKLTQSGFIAYFAGGWVRDYLRDAPSEDIDIATDADPAQIEELFDRTVSVGMSFGVMVVLIEGHTYEVATFRRDLEYVDGRHPVGVVRSTPEEDALRRDFTVNGMFYDPLKEEVLDFVGGRADIERKWLRTIGDPELRFQEDRLRMLRAVRFTVSLQYTLDEATAEAISRQAHTIFPAVAIERVWQELGKIAALGGPAFVEAVRLMHRLSLLGVILPPLKGVLAEQLEALLQPIARYLAGLPPILYLVALFPELKREEAEALVAYFKGTHKDRKLALEWIEGLSLCHDPEAEAWDWVRFYAKPDSATLLTALGTHFPERPQFYEKQQQRQKQLASHIDRLRQKKPLVTSQMLLQEGINAGPAMGALLQEAMRLSANEAIERPEDLMRRLKRTLLWATSP